MNELHAIDKLSFRVHLIRVYGRKRDHTVRVLLVETTSVQAVYEGFASLSKCMRWINRLSAKSITKDELRAVLKLLERKKLATIQDILASPHDLESLGLLRADTLD